MSTATEPTKRTPRTRRQPGELLTPLTMPFTLAVDTREQDAYRFTGIVGDSADKGRPIIVPTLITTLKTGDYSIVGMESLVTVERKSASDLFSTLSAGRDRFEAEHQRMAEIIAAGGHAVVVIEADWRTMLADPPCNSRLNPLSVFRTAISWTAKYRVAWWAIPGRRFAELTCFQILRDAWKKQQEQLSGEI